MSLRPLSALALLAASADAQFLPRTVWSGDGEPFRRDHAQDTEFLVDRGSIVDAPPWWSRGAPFTDRIAVVAVSVTSSELKIEAAADLVLELGSAWAHASTCNSPSTRPRASRASPSAWWPMSARARPPSRRSRAGRTSAAPTRRWACSSAPVRAPRTDSR